LNLRKIAIQAIESRSSHFGISFCNSSDDAALTATEKIVLGRKYFLSSWVEGGYTELAKNGDISDTDMREIGSEVSFQLMRISLGIQKQPKSRSQLNKTIGRTFQVELQSIAAAEEAFLVPEIQKVKEAPFGMGGWEVEPKEIAEGETWWS
jgi:hypothetical protein